MPDDASRPAQTRADYPHFTHVETRWMDNDIYGHVNNVVYYSYFDTVVNRFLIAEGGLDIRAGEVIGVVAETQCRFARSLSFPDVIDAGLRVGKLGTSSVRYELGLFAAGENEAAAAGYFVHVFVDRGTRRPVAIPPRIRAALQPLLRQTP